MSDQNEDPENFADDILKGAGEIGKFINENERRTRYIIEKKQIPENGGDKLVHGSGGISQLRAE